MSSTDESRGHEEPRDSPGPFRLAAAQYDIEFLRDWSAYEAKIGRWFAEAARERARFLVFPEYFSMELASLFAADVYGSLSKQLDALQTVLPAFLALFRELAKRHDVTVVAGSFPVLVGPETFHNRAHLVRPNGSVAHQDKIQMTRFESERWLVRGGDAVDAIATDVGHVGIAVCYDVEFPLIVRKLIEAGASLVVAPSCTDTLAGYHRVRIGAQARALENQCYVVQASTVGDAPWSEAVDVNVGAAGVYTPVDVGFPADGVLVAGELNVPGWVYGDLDLGALETVRATGQVFNHRDWPAQSRVR